MTNEYMDRDAVISECRDFRYTLTRRWGEGRRCVFVMLNPSTADGHEDDPTSGVVSVSPVARGAGRFWS